MCTQFQVDPHWSSSPRSTYSYARDNLGKTNLTEKYTPLGSGLKGHTKYKAAFNREKERGDNVMMEASLQDLQLNKFCTVAKDYVLIIQAYMKLKLNKYSA